MTRTQRNLYLIFCAALLALGWWAVCAPQQPHRFVRQDVKTDYILWREVHPTTFHGICASVLGNTKGDVWAVYHPYGHRKNKDGLVGSPRTNTHAYGTRDEAVAWAESVCPTK